MYRCKGFDSPTAFYPGNTSNTGAITMYTSILCTLLLLLNVSVAERYLDHARRYSGTNEKTVCFHDAEQCGQQHLGHHQPEDNLDYIRGVLGNRTYLGEIAADLEKAVNCLEGVTSRASCSFMSEWSVPARFVSDFVNSHGIIDKFVDVTGSPCLASNDLLRNLEHELDDCLVKFELAVYSKTGDLCGHASQMLQCVESGGTQTCGAAVGNLIRAGREFALSPSRGPGLLNWLTSYTLIDFASCEQQLIISRPQVGKRWSFLSHLVA